MKTLEDLGYKRICDDRRCIYYAKDDVNINIDFVNRDAIKFAHYYVLPAHLTFDEMKAIVALLEENNDQRKTN